MEVLQADLIEWFKKNVPEIGTGSSIGYNVIHTLDIVYGYI